MDKLVENAVTAAQEQLDSKVVEAPVVEAVETQTTDEQHEDIKVKEVLEEKETKKKPNLKEMANKAMGKKTAPVEPEPEEITDQEADAEIEQETAEEETLSAEPIKPPAFWTAERKKLFEKAPRELQEVISQRELELQQQISRAAQGSNGNYEKRFFEDFESPEAANLHKAKLKAQGINDPISELHRYRAWDRVLEADPHAVISDLMRKNGFTLNDFYNEANEVQEPNQYKDPRVEDALKRAEAAENAVKEWQSQQELNQKMSFINSFKEGLDSDGQKRKDFCELYSFQIDNAYQKAKADYPMATEDQLLNHAYEQVKDGVKAFHGLNAQPKTQAPVKPVLTNEQRIANAKKAQSAASNSVGGPNTGTVSQKPRLKGKNFSEKFDSAFEIAEARMNSSH
jgi:hypothetical protein